MDQKLMEDIQKSLVAVENHIKDMAGLQELNERLDSAKEEITQGAKALKKAADEFPATLSNFATLSQRLEALAKVLEGSDLAVLVTKVNKIEQHLQTLQEKIAKLDQIEGSLESLRMLYLNQNEEQNKLALAITSNQESIESLDGIVKSSFDDMTYNQSIHASYTKKITSVTLIAVIILLGYALTGW